MTQSGEKQLTVYIVHSLPLLMSVVQLFVGSQMAFVAHLVNADTVGSDKHLGVNFRVYYAICL